MILNKEDYQKLVEYMKTSPVRALGIHRIHKVLAYHRGHEKLYRRYPQKLYLQRFEDTFRWVWADASYTSYVRETFIDEVQIKQAMEDRI